MGRVGRVKYVRNTKLYADIFPDAALVLGYRGDQFFSTTMVWAPYEPNIEA